MLKQNINRAILGLVLIPFLGFGTPGFAQTATAVTGTVSVSPTVIGTTIPQPVDEETADVVQLSNLRLQSISGPTLPAVLTAAYDYGIKCQRYESDASNKPLEIVCPLPPTVLYQIRVDSDTLLFLRNRVRAKISDFEVGDMVNVYGFMDRTSRVVDALVLRDLDKPKKEIPVQLNNVQVVTLPSGNLPTTFTVVRAPEYPCLNFEDNNAGKPAPCPLSVNYKEYQTSLGEMNKKANSAATTTGAAMPEYYQVQQKYLIEVTASTNVLDRNRNPIKLSELAVGDKLNIYGSKSGSVGSIRANVIRDLSAPADKEFGTLRVTVSDSNVVCISIVGPCGLIYNASVQAFGPKGESYGVRSTASGYAYFEKLQPGTYKIVAEAKGYGQASAEAQISAGENESLNISLSGNPTDKLSISSLTPTNGPVGTTVTIKGYGFAPTDNIVNFGYGQIRGLRATYADAGAQGDVSRSAASSISFTVPSSLEPACSFATPSCAMKSILTLPGKYSISVQNANGNSNTMGFEVTAKITSGTPTVSGVSGPTTLRSGEQGTWTIAASDSTGGILSYSVVWGDEGGYYSESYRASALQAERTATFTHTYSSAGNYSPKFTVVNASGASAQTSLSVNVGFVYPTTPVITYLRPASGSVGASVIITGKGFAPTGNKIKFGDLGSENNSAYSLDSLDGRTITFKVPESNYYTCWNTSPQCNVPAKLTQPGTYWVSVINENGASNEVFFTVIAATPTISPSALPKTTTAN